MPLDTGSSPTLFIVEDNAIVREGLAIVLRRVGYDVTVAKDGREALDRLHRGPKPALILLDMILPGLDGWMFLKERKRDVCLAAIPVVIMTGIGSASLEWAKSLGAAGLLLKPIDVEVLLEEISRHC